MKKYILFLITLLFFSCTTTKVEIPDWVTNYHHSFPDDEYLVQRGIGKTTVESKNEALEAISYYLNSTVEGIRSSNFTQNEIIENGERSVSEQNITVRDSQISTSASLFGVQYTDPWYNKKEKVYYCVCYINRKDAWNNYEPQVRIEKDSFLSYYKKAEEAVSPIEKLKFYSYAIEQSKVFLEKVSYIQLFSEELTELTYSNELTIISSLKNTQKEIISKTPIYVNVHNDVTNEVASCVENAFKNCGFNISSKKVDNGYTAECNLYFLQNVSDDIIVCNPSFELKLMNELKEDYSFLIDAKTVKSYTDVQITKKAIKAICDEINNNLELDFKATISGKK